MSSASGNCSICQRYSNSFNYGVLCCNSCKIFFRRAIFGKAVKCCQNSGECDSTSCRWCRLKKCIESGMKFKMTQIQSDQDDIFKLLENLKVLNTQRNRLLLNFRFEGDPTVEELARLPGPIHFQSRPENYQLDNIEWGNLAALTTIDYMKKFNFMNLLEFGDQVILIRNSFTDFDMLSNALRSYGLGKAESSFPDGSDLFVKTDTEICKNLENNIRCRLIGRLVDLQITAEEFLLLTSIFFCNPEEHLELEKCWVMWRSLSWWLMAISWDWSSLNDLVKKTGGRDAVHSAPRTSIKGSSEPTHPPIRLSLTIFIPFKYRKMSYLFRTFHPSTIPSEFQVSDPEASTKKRVRALSRHVQFELERTIEEESGFLEDRPRIPLFFTRSFNQLQSQLISINHKDRFLNTMQHMARCSLLSEFGPPTTDYYEFPEYLENGLLEIKFQSLEDEIETFVHDVSMYILFDEHLTGVLRPLPISYHISMETYKDMADGCSTTKELVDRIPDMIKNFLGGFQNVTFEEDYFENCNQQYKELLDSFNA